jgi:hypothetical protein
VTNSAILPGNEVDDIPWEGLEEVLAAWSGQGQLYEALASVRDDDDIAWSRWDVMRRAHRVLFAQLAPLVERWPISRAAWVEALPAQSVRSRRLAAGPQAGVDWVATRMRGWPPEQFVVHDRDRVADQTMVRTLRWVVERLGAIRRDAVGVDPSLALTARRQVEIALSLLGTPPVADATSLRPESSEIDALGRSGPPWTVLAPVARVLRTVSTGGLEVLAFRHLIPDESLRWRLFHLGVLGVLLRSLRERGARVISLRPLSGSTSDGPNYHVAAEGQTWDLWFEAAGIWSHYGIPSPYGQLAGRAFSRPTTPLAPDIVLISVGKAAYVIECKYGTRDYIAHSGYQQVVTYAHELRQLAPRVSGLVVGPDPLIVRPALHHEAHRTIGLAGPRFLHDTAVFDFGATHGNANSADPGGQHPLQ